MDPVIQAVVNALAAGALAVSKDIASDAVKTTYAALKSFILGRVARAANMVAEVHDEPGEKSASQLAEKLGPLAGDSEAQNLAAELQAAIEHIRNQPGADAVMTLLGSTIGTFTATNNQSSRPLVHATNSIAGTVTFTGNTFIAPEDKKKPTPPSP